MSTDSPETDPDADDSPALSPDEEFHQNNIREIKSRVNLNIACRNFLEAVTGLITTLTPHIERNAAKD